MSFSLTHLHNICAFHKVSDSINIKISENYPLKTTYLLENGSSSTMEEDENDDDSSKARIVVYLAPRMTDDE
jgi:hypothetical protein